MSSLTVQYNGSTIQTVSEDKTIALKCAGQLMADDVTLVADGLSSLDVIYNGASILSETDATGTWKLKTSGKIMSGNVSVEVKAAPAYLTFSSPNEFTLGIADNTKHWDGTLEYSTNAKDWTVWPGTSAISSSGGKLYMRGTGNTVITGGYNGRWVLSGSNIRCDGNIETLLDYGTVASGSHPQMAGNCYDSMFDSCTSLTTAPSLPATTLADSCYIFMFNGCTGLTQAPSLPATTLAGSCYVAMFWGCTGLTQAPSLPATTLADSCYDSMFRNCTSLTTAPNLPATTLASYCYNYMFWDCTGLTQAPSLPATTLAASCYRAMFRGCTKIKVSTTSGSGYSYAYRIPKSGTGTTATNALSGMFSGTGGTFTDTPTINTTYYMTTQPIG